MASDSGLTYTTDADAPVSGPNVGMATYRAGFVAGSEPMNLFKTIPAARETLYVAFWVKFSSNWVGHASGVNKILHVFIAGRNRVVISATGAGANNLVPQFRLQEIAGPSAFRNLDPNIVPTARFNRGQWHRVDFVLRANTAGNADGHAEWWLDGVKVGAHVDVPYVTATQAHNWTSVNWAPTYGGTGGSVSTAQMMFMDHIYISGK